jgi:hypothetical protein
LILLQTLWIRRRILTVSAVITAAMPILPPERKMTRMVPAPGRLQNRPAMPAEAAEEH